jgi:hypothetical protein
MARPTKGYTDTTELQQGQNQSHDMPASGPIDRTEFLDNFEILDREVPKAALDAAAFFEEELEVEILPTENPNAEAVIQLQCNGVNQFLVRGVPAFIKRKYVEILARAKTENVATPEFIDANGNRSTRVTKSQGLRYPFRVLQDRNPQGRAWLENVMRQGA